MAITQQQQQQETCHRKCRVAVIGAGASGLVAARELRREGHDVVVFEQQGQLGGTWLYTDEVDSDLFGTDAARVRVHSSMYQGLTTNLPREIMGFSDYVFSAANMAGHSMDGRRYPCSEEVLRYLQAFADHYSLQPLIRFNTHVIRTTPLTPQQQEQQAAGGGTEAGALLPWQRWVVEWRTLPAGSTSKQAAAAADGSTQREVFDALLVCNGHYSEPQLPLLPGAADFPGLLMHSHNYRSAERFNGQAVAVIGASFSGLDVARLVAEEAHVVYVCAREWKTQQDLDRGGSGFGGRSNIERRGMITCLTKAGAAEFSVGEAVTKLDAVICCTGYNYYFPFLDMKALGLSTAQQHVAPLYQHMFPPAHAPGLAFIGLPWRVVPFPMFELQAKLCARLLSGRSSLPGAAAMSDWAQQHAQQLLAEGLPTSYSHYMDYKQLSYHAWLAAACGRDVPRLPGWRAAVMHCYWLWRWLLVVGLGLLRGSSRRKASSN